MRFSARRAIFRENFHPGLDGSVFRNRSAAGGIHRGGEERSEPPAEPSRAERADRADRTAGHGEGRAETTRPRRRSDVAERPKIDILTDNPDKHAQLLSLGIEVRNVVPTGVYPSAANVQYLQATVSPLLHTRTLPIAG
jgi:hypothetical protein